MLECVPNFSEARDFDAVEEILGAIKSAEILNVHTGIDHNRTVATFTGSVEQAVAAAFELSRSAVELLDIREHIGVHPFIGVVDVIPFIPLEGSTMDDAVSAAHILGEKLWKELKLPVYFYGHAGLVDLPFVRKNRGKFDIGDKLNPHAGAVAIGARDFLIAFNINLNTPDFSIAQSIAKNIREKRSGMKGVRALGLYLESRNVSQVSINITDCRATTLKMVFDAVSKWAREYKVEIIESELVGMLPRFAVFPEMARYLHMGGFSEKKILC